MLRAKIDQDGARGVGTDMRECHEVLQSVRENAAVLFPDRTGQASQGIGPLPLQAEGAE